MGGPANKGIYKYVQICTHRINEREGNHNYPKWGFDCRCLNMVQYLHKNLRLIKEKFQYWRWWIKVLNFNVLWTIYLS